MYTNEYRLATSNSNEHNELAPQVANGVQIIRYLRWAGSVLIILSAIGFMLQSHADLLPAYRYWAGLAIVVALCAGGLACNYLLKETKGTRLFFALGAGFLPVQVSQVGAMLYAFVQGRQAPQPAYSWLQFSGVSPALIGINLIITVFLLITVSYTSFSMLAKRQAKPLLQAALLGNLLLLLPIRDGYGLPIMIVLLFGWLNVVERKLQLDSTMKLAEGLTARALMSLPLLIIIGRSLLYPFSFWLTLTIAAIVATIGIIDTKRYTQSALVIYVSQCLGTLAALSIWPMTIDHFVGYYQNVYSMTIPVALVLFGLSTQVTYHAKLYRTLASLLATGLIYAALLNDQAFAPLLALATGIALVCVGGLKYREKLPFFLGQLNFLGGILFYCGYLVDAYNHAPWLFSIGLGLAVLFLASVLEKKHQVIVNAASNYWNELKDWD